MRKIHTSIFGLFGKFAAMLTNYSTQYNIYFAKIIRPFTAVEVEVRGLP